MTSLSQKLSGIVGAAFERQGLPAEFGVVRVSDRPDLAQFQCNGAMAAAKRIGKNPRDVAQGVVEVLASPTPTLPPGGGGGFPFAKVEIAGPGFINLDVTDEFIAAHLAGLAAEKHFGAAQDGAGRTAILDYGGPNIAKPMHVGHLRSSIIGDAMRRIFDFAGYKTVSDVHLGDWGLQMGQVLSELEERGLLGQPLTLEALEEIYPAASQACKADDARMEKARIATRKFQDGDEVYRKAVKQFTDVSIEGMKANFDALGVHFDEWKGEAYAHPFIAPMVEDLKAKGVASESDGALVVDVSQDDDKKEMPPLILLKSDGAVIYGSTDLGTIVDRMRTHNPNQILYFVDKRQSLHFEQVFRAARKGGLVGDGVELIFAGFGTMNGTDGKPFKTRAGGVMRLEDLIAQAIEKAQARLDEAHLADDIDMEERADIADKVALAAIKFADLQNPRQSDYVFDLDRMTSFEGKTGPYLLYQAVRIQSLLRKAESQGFVVADGADIAVDEGDRGLALLLAEFPDHFALAISNHTPHVLCEYAYRLAQEFSSFYGHHHILSESDEALRAARLGICELTHRQLVLILGMLGIEIPERM